MTALVKPDLDGGLEGALRTLQHEQHLLSPKYQDQQWRANRYGAHSDILDFERAFVRRMKKLGVPMFAHNMVRSLGDQQKLYAEGVTRTKSDSPHMFGCAVDIVHGVRAWDLTRAEWSILGHIGKEVAKGLGLKLTWGGDWQFYDPAHWELTDWRKIAGRGV